MRRLGLWYTETNWIDGVLYGPPGFSVSRLKEKSSLPLSILLLPLNSGEKGKVGAVIYWEGAVLSLVSLVCLFTRTPPTDDILVRCQADGPLRS